MIRILRLCRVTFHFPNFRIFAITFYKVIPKAGSLFSLLFIIFYFYVLMTMSVFGGKIYEGEGKRERDMRWMIKFTISQSTIILSVSQSTISHLGSPLTSSDFSTNLYFPNNFNDFPSSFVSFFELLVVNNW